MSGYKCEMHETYREECVSCRIARRTNEAPLDDLICQFTEDLPFEALKPWCGRYGVDYQEPPTDDMYPDWEQELRGELAEAMMKGRG